MQQRVAGIEKTAAAIREVGDHDPGLKEGELGQLTKISCERIAFLKTDGKFSQSTRNFGFGSIRIPRVHIVDRIPRQVHAKELVSL
jgi:hypothetical protein